MSADAAVLAFPRDGFMIGGHLCNAPGPEDHLMCFGAKGHEGEHQWSDWRGCRIRVPFGSGSVPFGGFAG